MLYFSSLSQVFSLLKLRSSGLLVLGNIMATSSTSAVKRTACDRCHHQKMRCIRDSASKLSKCNRCITASADCKFSLARKAGRPVSKKRFQDSQRSQEHGEWESTQLSGDVSASLLNAHGTSDSSVSVTSSSPGVRSIFDTPMLEDGSNSSNFSSSLSETGAAALDLLDWGDLQVGQDTDALWKDTQFELDQLPQHIQLMDAMEEPLHACSSMETGVQYGDHVQRLSSLCGEIFEQTNVHHNNVSPIDNIRTLIAHAISSSSTLLDILTCLRDTLAQQEIKISGHYTTSLLDPENNNLDTATTLQILTVYIRLIQLHFTLYTRIHTLLLSSATSSTFSTSSTLNNAPATPPAFPSLMIGGISLAPYSRFQLRFLLQICVHHLGEIEALLGLPAGFRVSDVGQGNRERVGILGGRNGDTSLLVRTVMMGAGTSVRGIGETLEQLKTAFEGSIRI